MGQAFYVPGEHDVFGDEAKLYLERYGKGTRGTGWQSFDYQGVHFVGLVNVMNLKAGGLGVLGDEQLAWLKQDLASLGDSTPIVVFAHVPLWTVYPQWGWGTQDSALALGLLKRFGSVTVLNGHIHQILQKVEGNITFHTALDRVPATRAGQGRIAGPNQDRRGRQAQGNVGRLAGQLRRGSAVVGDRRHDARRGSELNGPDVQGCRGVLASICSRVGMV